MKKELNVLLLEDNESDGLLLKRRLKKNWQDLHIHRIYTEESLINAIEECSWDIIISDYKMPHFTGFDALRIIKRYDKDIPFILVSGAVGEETAVKIMKAGAQDYILKDKLDRLVPAIEREIKEAEVRKNKSLTEAALRESEKNWSITFSAIADGIILLDEAGEILQFNPAASNIFGMSSEQFSSLNCFKISEILKKENREFICSFERMQQKKERIYDEFRINLKWYLLTIDPVISENGKIEKAIYVLKDITAIKESRIELESAHKKLEEMHKDLEIKVKEAVADSKAQEYLIMQQTRQAAIGNMLSRIAHHWRQPLNAIGVMIQDVGDRIEFDDFTKEELMEKINKLMDILKKLSRSIDEFRDTYTKESSKSEFSIEDSLTQMIEFENKKYQKLSVRINEEICGKCMITGYASEFYHAVTQIIENAFEVLDRRNIDNPEIKIKCEETNDSIMILIADNGGGIDPEIKDNMFELYTTTKNKLNNTGVGLYTAQLIIEKNMKGNIGVKQKEDGYTEFIITLPK